VHGTDSSAGAIEVARRNVADSGYGERIVLFQGDLFEPLGEQRYDLILANPPYVSAAAMAALPPEYQHEPRLALAGGVDGLDVVRRILRESRAHLTEHGGLICEIGTGRALLEAEFPHLPFTWLDTEASTGEVFWLGAQDFAPARPVPPLPRERRRGAQPSRRTGKRTRTRRR
jgi:ribosomal protein L3 glutamine methyltransferase